MATYEEKESLNDLEVGETFEELKERIFIRAFNKMNLPFGTSLKDVPHINKFDLALTYSVEEKTYIDNNKGVICYLIKNSDLEQWNITKEELHEIAINNFRYKNNIRVETITKHIMRFNLLNPILDMPENIGIQIDLKPSGKRSFTHTLFESEQYAKTMFQDYKPEREISNNSEPDILVITNRSMNFGASGLFFEDALEEVYDKFRENFYILPVSIHELLCVKYSFAMKNSDIAQEAEQDLMDMIEHINDLIITEDLDILSYNIYYHMHDERCTIMIK